MVSHSGPWPAEKLRRVLERVAGTGAEGVVLFCDGQTKAIDVDLATVRDELYQDIMEKKMRMGDSLNLNFHDCV